MAKAYGLPATQLTVLTDRAVREIQEPRAALFLSTFFHLCNVSNCKVATPAGLRDRERFFRWTVTRFSDLGLH